MIWWGITSHVIFPVCILCCILCLQETTTRRRTDGERRELDKTEATAYLKAWEAKRKAESSGVEDGGGGQAWKFNKNTQAWLLRNMFSEDMVEEVSFSIMCKYLEGLKGASRQVCVKILSIPLTLAPR
ncbi:unnamed protein product [Discosporangium mesarthrocarpum]